MFLTSGGLQLWGSMEQAELTRRQAELNRQVSEFNAEDLEQSAWEAEKFGYTQVARYQSTVDEVISKQRVRFAAEGVDITFGTAAEIQEESRMTATLNALDIQKAARERAQNLRTEAANVRLQGFLGVVQGEAQASAETISGFAGAGQSFVQAAGAGGLFDPTSTGPVSPGGGGTSPSGFGSNSEIPRIRSF
jgi:hypothetical protein